LGSENIVAFLPSQGDEMPVRLRIILHLEPVLSFSLICRQDGPMPDWQGSTLMAEIAHEAAKTRRKRVFIFAPATDKRFCFILVSFRGFV
jgi:hypothetical protein